MILLPDHEKWTMRSLTKTDVCRPLAVGCTKGLSSNLSNPWVSYWCVLFSLKSYNRQVSACKQLQLVSGGPRCGRPRPILFLSCIKCHIKNIQITHSCVLWYQEAAAQCRGHETWFRIISAGQLRYFWHHKMMKKHSCIMYTHTRFRNYILVEHNTIPRSSSKP